MSAPQLTELLAGALHAAADVARLRLERSVTVVAAEPPECNAFLRFELHFEGDARLTWFVSNEDATGFSDLLIGGAGDRGAVLTEMHLDALSGVFSDMLERAVDGLNAGLASPLAAGGVDMGMEGALPEPEPGEERLVLALQVDGFGAMPIAQHANAAMAALLRPHLDGGAVGLAGLPQDHAAAGAQPPVGAQTAAHTTDAAASSNVDNVVPLPNFAANAPKAKRDLSMLLNVPLRVTVELGRTERTIRDLMELSVGSILELSKLAGDPMDIMVNGRVLARGEVVVIDEEFGIRVTEICSPEERLQNLG